MDEIEIVLHISVELSVQKEESTAIADQESDAEFEASKTITEIEIPHTWEAQSLPHHMLALQTCSTCVRLAEFHDLGVGLVLNCVGTWHAFDNLTINRKTLAYWPVDHIDCSDKSHQICHLMSTDVLSRAPADEESTGVTLRGHGRPTCVYPFTWENASLILRSLLHNYGDAFLGQFNGLCLPRMSQITTLRTSDENRVNGANSVSAPQFTNADTPLVTEKRTGNDACKSIGWRSTKFSAIAKNRFKSALRTELRLLVLLNVAAALPLVSAITNIDLANGPGGAAPYLQFSGAKAGDQQGYAVSGVGDINNDGYGDVAIGAPLADGLGRNDSGVTYVLFGRSGQTSAQVDFLTDWSGSLGFKIIGSSAGDNLGFSVSGAGDMNADGIDDLIVGAPFCDTSVGVDSGCAAVIFGKSSGWSDIDLSTFTSGGAGFNIYGNGYVGWSVSDAGDINGDGADDVIVGARSASFAGRLNAGAAFVIFGHQGSFVFPNFNLDTFAASSSTGFRMKGAYLEDRAGSAVSGVGDINMDGFDDIAVGAPNANPYGRIGAGAVFVIFGHSGAYTDLDLANWPVIWGFLIGGAMSGDGLGGAVDRAGDTNGDGYPDIIVGAGEADHASTPNSGYAYIICGHRNTTAFPTIDVSALADTATGVSIRGAQAEGRFGARVSGGIDVTGDGIQDVIVGAPLEATGARFEAGAAYVIPGRNSFWTVGDIDISAAVGTNGIYRIAGAGATAQEHFGYAVDVVSDFDWDGIGDLLIGANYVDGNARSDAGAAYLVHGRTESPTSQPTNQPSAQPTNNPTALPPGGGRDIDLALGPSKTAKYQQIFGAKQDDQLGTSVKGIGDINNDGYGDVAVGAVWANAPGQYELGIGPGAVFVQFGRAGESIAQLDMLTWVTGAMGFKIFGYEAGDYFGCAVSGAGDMNNDGIDDFVVGSHSCGYDQRGCARVFFGKTTAWSDIDLAVNASAGFTIHGEMIGGIGGRLGYAVSSAGDMNGDGADDIVLGAYEMSPFGRLEAGSAYVIFGRSSGTGFADVNLTTFTASATSGFRMLGATPSASTGIAVSRAGDVNVDGYDDIIVGAPTAVLNDGNIAGIAYLIFGHGGDYVDLDFNSWNSSWGFRLFGALSGGALGMSVGSAGDTNGDGYPDVIIGSGAGAAYIVFGHSSTRGYSDMDVNSLIANATGVRIREAQIWSDFGGRVSGGIDVSGDGIPDMIVGAQYETIGAEDSAGAAYVILGQSSSWSVLDIEITALMSTNKSIKIIGAESDDRVGTSVDVVADVNGDGLGDVLIGAPGVNPFGLSNRSNAGAAYLIYGRTYSHFPQPTSQPSRQPSAQPSMHPSAALPWSEGRNIDVALGPTKAGPFITINGEKAGDSLGFSVGDAGDINGDGYSDLVVGAVNAGQSITGIAYVLFGKNWLSTTAIDWSTSQPNGVGVRILGAVGKENTGWAVSGAGDINHDGIDDLIVGIRLCDTVNGGDSGCAVIIFGKTTGWEDIDLATFISGSVGFKVLGEAASGHLGVSVNRAGDVNGDGIADFILGAPLTTFPGRTESGAAYVIFGRANIGEVDLASFTSSATAGFRIKGAFSGDNLGLSVSGAGDVNRDGCDDVILGAPTWEYPANPKTNSGGVFVIFGHRTNTAWGDLDLQNWSASWGFRIVGAVANDWFGYSVSSAGDLNFDGYADVLAVATDAGAQGRINSGIAYIAFGHSNSTAFSDIDTSVAGSTLRIFGAETGSNIGSACGGYDVNGDGVSDVVLGAYMEDPSGRGGAGAAYVIPGRSGVTAMDVDLATAVGMNGIFKMSGAAADDRLGYSVALIRDYDGDGLSEVLVGARYTDPNGRNGAGSAYLFFGRPESPTSQPSTQPSRQPSAQPSRQPSAQPSSLPSSQPSAQPSSQPSTRPSALPTERLLLGGGLDIDLSLKPTAAGKYRTFAGAAAENRFGFSISGAGDINKDGYEDIIVGAPFVSHSGMDAAGVAYVFFGEPRQLTTTLDMATAAPSAKRIRILGANAFERLGYSVACAGDVNRDGVDDILVGVAYRTVLGQGEAGGAIVIFGKGGTWTDIYTATFVTGSAGFRILGEVAYGYFGKAVSSAGDVNGDGASDVIVGAPAASIAATANGASYVIFGHSNATLFADVAISTWVGPSIGVQGFRIVGAANGDQSGSVSGIGDLNDDGFDDVIVGSCLNTPSISAARTSAGTAYVLFGHGSTFTDIYLASWSNAWGFRIFGAAPHDQLGSTVWGVGDVNGDGIADCGIGAPRAGSANGDDSGIVYVLYGHSNAGSFHDTDLQSFTAGATGYRIIGAQMGGMFGSSLGGRADVNGDGVADIVAGSYLKSVSGKVEAGAAYVIPGRVGANQQDINLAAPLLQHGAFKISGASASYWTGFSAALVRDYDGDGYGEVLVGAVQAALHGRENSGAAYLIYGRVNMPTSQPSMQPSAQPTAVPTRQPTSQPSRQPSAQPTAVPSKQPTSQPSRQPSAQPTAVPSKQPTSQPSRQPSAQPTAVPSKQPTLQPSRQPTGQPSAQPTRRPSGKPSAQPSRLPSSQPSVKPSKQPSAQPSRQPTSQPSALPTAQPSVHPTAQPTRQPISQPSANPSRQPTGQPTLRPSQQPSSVPSRQPTAQPSRSPTEQPTGLPSVQPSQQPSSQPSNAPSGQPSMQPTLRPSAAPSQQPSALPSSQPSSTPTIQETDQPTGQPSMQPSSRPSCYPTMQPSVQPSALPSSAPTIQLSSHPSSAPSGLPSASPTVLPSMQPSAAPSNFPSTQPSAQPTTQPTSQSTTQPSVQPSAQPTTQPTSQPTTQPSGNPSSQPSHYPTGQPSRQPSSQPTTQRTAGPTGQPSAQPSSAPSRQPTTQPSRCPSAQPSSPPSSQPSSAPTAQPSRQPAALPTSLPSGQPTSWPSGQPTGQPSSRPTLQVVDSDQYSTAAAPNITSMAVLAARMAVTVKITMSGAREALMHCAVFRTVGSSTYQLRSVSEVLLQNIAAYSVRQQAQLTLRGLQAATDYTLYCATQSLQGHLMPYAVVLRNAHAVSTLCCRDVVVDLAISSVPTGKLVSGAVSVSVPVVPATSLTIGLALVGAVSTSSTLFPSTVQYTSASVASPTSVLLSAGSAGQLQVEATLSGAASAQYQVVYRGFRTLNVLSAASAPPVPAVVSAQFSSDGRSVMLTFSAATNKAGYSAGFYCGALLQFSGATDATCTWSSQSAIAIYPKYLASQPSAALRVGSPVQLLAGRIRAQCTGTNVTWCNTWSTVPSTTVYVSAPSTPQMPTATLSAPSQISACSALTLDLTTSVGSAGRPWGNISFAVATTPDNSMAIRRLSNWLKVNYTLNPPSTIPNGVLQAATAYRIDAQLCNFLGACGSATKVVAVSDNSEAAPIVSILGSAVKAIRSRDELAVVADAYTLSCAGAKSYSGLQLTWTAWELSADGTLIPLVGVRSTSQSPSTYKLAPYTLLPEKTYRVQLNVTTSGGSSGGLSTVSSTTVQVQRGSVYAIVTGSATRLHTAGNVLVLDASNSYDEDVQGLKASAAGLQFSWSCLQTAPAFVAECPLLVLSSTNLTQQTLTVLPSIATAGTTFQFTVTVNRAGRSSSAAVSVSVVAIPVSQITISSPLQSTLRMSADRDLVLFGTLKLVTACTAVWSVDETAVAIDKVARTATRQALLPSLNPQIFNLVLSGGTLPESASLTFSLRCGEAFASWLVTTNGGPLPGEFTVTPADGVELVTKFLFTAELWSDPDLPLTYQFGFESEVSLSKLVIVSKSEISYSTTTLPAGAVAAQFQLNCTLDVFDWLGASAQRIVAVEVRRAPTTLQPSTTAAAVQALLDSSTGSTSDTKRILSVATTVINSVNCTAAPNCSALNRNPCGATDHTCGTCMQGYAGDSGDQNTACFPRSLLAGNFSPTVRCSHHNQCQIWEYCDAVTSLCTLQTKACVQNCSGHGTCIHTSQSLGISLSNAQCRLNFPDCAATCACEDQYSGRACEISNANLRFKRTSRSLLVNQLNGLTQQDDVNEQSVLSWSDNLYSLALRPFEISATDTTSIMKVANATLQSAQSIGGIVADGMRGVLQALDAVTSVTRYNYNPNDPSSPTFNTSYVFINNTAASLLPVVRQFGDLVASSKVVGENATSYVYENFRMAVSKTKGEENSTHQTALSDAELQLGVQPSTVSLTVNSTAAQVPLSVKLVTTYPRNYALDTSAYVSTPVVLQVQAADEDIKIREHLSSIEFTFQHNVPQSHYEHYEERNFTTTCTERNASKVFTYQCPDSSYVIQHNCSQGSGTHVSYCPRPAAACAKVALDSATISYPSACRVVHYTASYTTCRCEIGKRAHSDHRRLVQTIEEEILDDTGATDMMASTVYIASDFADTFTAAEEFNTHGGAQAVIVVILMLGTLWIPALLLVALDWTGLRWWDKKKSKLVHPSEQQVHSLVKYAESVVPRVFRDTAPRWQVLFTEIAEHHLLFKLFLRQSRKERLAALGRALTQLTFMLFLTAVFFDISQPSDDGTCPSYTSEKSCLNRRSPFDYSQRYCTWVETDQGGMSCVYNDGGLTTTALFYMTVLVTLLTSLASIPISYLFSTLKAPTANTLKGTKVSAAVNAMAAGVRRLSNAGMALVQTARVAPASTKSRRRTMGGSILHRLSLLGRSGDDVVSADRDIPEETEQAAKLAQASLSVINANVSIMRVAQERKSRVMRTKSMRLQRKTTVKSINDGTDSSVRGAEAVVPDASNDAGAMVLADIVQQRQLMNDASAETVRYDRLWGIAVTVDDNGDRHLSVAPVAAQAISDCVQSAVEEAQNRAEVLSNYSIHHAGLEILHLFMVDLLGRETVAAKVFKEKFGEEFEHSRVVMQAQKYMAGVVLLGLNAFFMYYILLKGFQEGLTWQYQYLVSCVVQVVVDVLLFETVECVWLNFSVPQYVREDVAAAAEKLLALTKGALEHRGDIEQSALLPLSKFFFNAPAHLFVSLQLAKRLPHLLESMLVSSFRDHLPGAICKTWPHCKEMKIEDRSGWYQVIGRILRMTVLGLEMFIVVPYVYQRILLRFLQPVVFSAVSIVFYAVVTSIAGLAVLSVAVALLVAYTLRQQLFPVPPARLQKIGVAVNEVPVLLEGIEDEWPESGSDKASSTATSVELSDEDSDAEEWWAQDIGAFWGEAEDVDIRAGGSTNSDQTRTVPEAKPDSTGTGGSSGSSSDGSDAADSELDIAVDNAPSSEVNAMSSDQRVDGVSAHTDPVLGAAELMSTGEVDYSVSKESEEDEGYDDHYYWENLGYDEDDAVNLLHSSVSNSSGDNSYSDDSGDGGDDVNRDDGSGSGSRDGSGDYTGDAHADGEHGSSDSDISSSAHVGTF